MFSEYRKKKIEAVSVENMQYIVYVHTELG